MEKATSKQTRLLQAKTFPWNGATGQIKQSSHGKRLARTRQESHRKEGNVSYDDRKSTWNSEVWKAITRGSAEEKVCKYQKSVQDCMTGRESGRVRKRERESGRE